MELTEYVKLLEAFDWQYDFSDDQSVWRKGVAEQNELYLLAKKNGMPFLDEYFRFASTRIRGADNEFC